MFKNFSWLQITATTVQRNLLNVILSILENQIECVLNGCYFKLYFYYENNTLTAGGEKHD